MPRNINLEEAESLMKRLRLSDLFFNRDAGGVVGARLPRGYQTPPVDFSRVPGGGIYTGPTRDPNLEYEARQLEIAKLMAPLEARLQQSREQNLTDLAQTAMRADLEAGLQGQKLGWQSGESMYDRALRAGMQREELGWRTGEAQRENAARAALLQQQYDLMGRNREAEQLLGRDIAAENLRTQYGLIGERDVAQFGREQEMAKFNDQIAQNRQFKTMEQQMAFAAKASLNQALGQARGMEGQLESPGVEKVKKWVTAAGWIDEEERSGGKYSPDQIIGMRQKLLGEINGTDLSLFKRGPRPGDILPGDRVGMSPDDLVMIDKNGNPQPSGWNSKALGQMNPIQWAQSQATFARPEVDPVTGEPTGRGYWVRSSQGRTTFVPTSQEHQQRDTTTKDNAAIMKSAVQIAGKFSGSDEDGNPVRPYSLSVKKIAQTLDQNVQITPQDYMDTVREWYLTGGRQMAARFLTPSVMQTQPQFAQQVNDPLGAANLIDTLQQQGVEGFFLEPDVKESVVMVQRMMQMAAQQQAAQQVAPAGPMPGQPGAGQGTPPGIPPAGVNASPGAIEAAAAEPEGTAPQPSVPQSPGFLKRIFGPMGEAYRQGGTSGIGGGAVHTTPESGRGMLTPAGSQPATQQPTPSLPPTAVVPKMSVVQRAIAAARAGDKEAQKALDKRGIQWQN